MRLMRVWVPTEFEHEDGPQTCVVTEIAEEPDRQAEHLFTEWAKDGSGCWVTWRLGDYSTEKTEEVIRRNAH